MSISRLPAHPGQNLTQRVDDQTSEMYVGYAPINTITSSASWSIKRITIAGTAITIEWADGNDLNDNIWDDRAILSYS